MKKNEMTYAQAMARLEEIVRRLETGDVSVDELAASVKEGVQLVDWCRKKLRTAEADVEAALKGLDADMAGTQEQPATTIAPTKPIAASDDVNDRFE